MTRLGRGLVALQLAALVVLGGVTVARFHVWAPVDERAHYDYVQTVAERHRLPLLTDLVSPEVQAITDGTWPRPSPVDPATRGLAGRSYEAFQPPLYYVVAVPAFTVAGDHLTKLKLLRAFDLALLLVAVGLLWRLSRRVAPAGPLLAFSAALTVLLWPGVLVRAVTVSSTALELVLVTALLLVLWRLLERPGRWPLLLAGVLLGACLLTKSTLIYLAPLAIGIAVADWRARRDTAGTIAAAVIPALMLLPWLIFNLRHYDAPTASGAARDQQAPVVNPLGLDYGVDDAVDRTVRLLKEVLPAEWWTQLDVGWVRVATLVLFGALFGVALVLAVAPPPGWSRRPLWFFGVPLVAGYATLVITMLGANWPSFNLRYLYPVLPALAVGVASAFAVRGTRYAWGVLVGCSVLLAAVWIDMAGAFYFTDIGDTLGI